MIADIMKIKPQQTEVQTGDLSGDYGDVFWDLPPVLSYVASNEISCRIYVANPTEIDRQYMLMASLSQGDNVISEFPLKVDEAVWFTVEAESVVGLPGALKVDSSDVVLTLNLYEKELNGVADSVATILSTAGATNLPILPGLPGSIQTDISGGLLDSIMPMMLLVMMGITMSKAVESR